MHNLVSLLGIVVLLALAWVLSNNRRLFPWRVTLWGIGLQLALALLLLKTPWGGAVFDGARSFVTRLLAFTDAGASFLWGSLFRTSADLVQYVGPEAGYIQVTNSASGALVPVGTIFVIHVLPTIIFFSSLMALLYHLGVMQAVIRGMAWGMRKTMGTSGSESFSCAANVFVGQTEAPLVIRPYLPTMTRSELMAVMVGGFATVAGGVMAAYVRFGVDAGHLLAASVMSAPAALVVAKIMYPETEDSPTRGSVTLSVEREYANVLDAAAGGAGVGLKLAANIGAMLLAFIALVAMLNYGLGFLGLSLQQIFGWVFSPIAWVMGVPWGEAAAFGNLLGTKIAVNEFVGYIELIGARDAGALSPRSVVIATYALCGFANFSSIAIQIGGIGTIAPGRRADVAALGLKAMFGGALASWLTATIAGVLIGGLRMAERGSERPLCVGQFIETMDMGGAEHLAVQIANELAARGHRSHLIVATGPGPLSGRISAAVHTHYVGFERASVRKPIAFATSVAGGVRRLGALVAREGIEVLQTHLPGANYWGLLLAWRRSCAVVATVHNNEEFRYGEHDSSVLRAARRLAYGQIVRCCGVVAVSATVKDSLVRQLGLGARLAGRITVVPNAVPVPSPPDPARRAALRARFGVGPGETFFLAAGRFTAQKNFGDLVTAASLLAADDVPFRLVIGGDGEERAALAARLVETGLAGRVALPGNLADLDQVMGAADVFVMSSLWEGLPLVLLEAMAAGLPTAAYAIDGVAELVRDGESGLLASMGDPAALAAALARLAADPDLRARCGAGAAADIGRRFSFDRLVDDLLACYRRTASG